MASFGEELRRERELRDISLKEIAESTNIPIRFLEALEQNNFEILPGGAYTRGFIRSYARHIGVNIEEMVDAYQVETARKEEVGKAQRTGGVSQASHPSVPGILGAFIAAAFVLGAGLIGVIYWAGASGPARGSAVGAGTHAATLKARVKRSGALPAPVTESVTPHIGEPEVPFEVAEEAPAAGEEAPQRMVRIRGRETTRVTLTCAGVTQYDRDLWVGAERHFPCREPILLSAGNGGAVEYAVDGAPSRYLGEPGESVRERMIVTEPAAPGDAGAPPRQKAPAAAPDGGSSSSAPAVDRAGTAS